MEMQKIRGYVYLTISYEDCKNVGIIDLGYISKRNRGYEKLKSS
jgi:hypothetical protein